MEIPLRRITKVKENSYEKAGIQAVVSTGTDPVAGLANLIRDQRWRIGEREIALQTSGLVSSWNPCGTIRESPFQAWLTYFSGESKRLDPLVFRQFADLFLFQT